MNYIKEIAKWQKERQLDKQPYNWTNEVTNIVEELFEANGYTIDKKDRLKFSSELLLRLIDIKEKLDLKNEKITTKDAVDAYCDIIVFCVGSIMKLGYDPECALKETIKEISSRTGSIVDGKFQKDTSEEARKRWYKADYYKCKKDK